MVIENGFEPWAKEVMAEAMMKNLNSGYILQYSDRAGTRCMGILLRPSTIDC